MPNHCSYQILLTVVMVVDSWADRAAQVVDRVANQIAPLVSDYEIVLVDNNSADNADIYRRLTSEGGAPNVQIYQLMKTVDFEIAAWAGVANSLGDWVLVFDPFSEDLSSLSDALAAAVGGRDLVLLVNTTPRASFVARTLQSLYAIMFRSLSGVDLKAEAAHHRLISKRVVTYLLQEPDPSHRYRTLPSIAGFAKAIIYYAAPRTQERDRRHLNDVRRGLRLLLSNSTAPLRLASLLGLMGAVLNIIYSIYVIAVILARSDVAPGWTTLSLQLSGMFFLISIIVSVVTEYFIIDLKRARGGPSYFVVTEMTSKLLTRQERRNVHRQTDQDSDGQIDRQE